jgi:hypothetical protein
MQPGLIHGQHARRSRDVVGKSAPDADDAALACPPGLDGEAVTWCELPAGRIAASVLPATASTTAAATTGAAARRALLPGRRYVWGWPRTGRSSRCWCW